MRRRAALMLIAMVAALCAAGAPAQLNRKVKVLASPTGPVPANCEQGLAPAAPRVEVEEPQPEVTPQAPPHSELQAAMHRLGRAAEGDDRAAFTGALAEARRVVAAYPNGGEKTAAEKALQVYADVDRVWSYAEAMPTGAFFDATSEGGGLLSTAKTYPGWAAAVADATLTTGGRTVYPTRETRKFIARASHVAPAPAQPRAKNAREHPRHRVPPASQPAPVKVATKRAVATPSRPAGKPAVHEAPPRAVVVPNTTTAPPPVVAPTTTTAPPPAVPTTTTSAPAPVTTTTAAPTSTTATTTAPEPAREKSGNINMIIAIILVIIGVGIAIVLFRASD